MRPAEAGRVGLGVVVMTAAALAGAASAAADDPSALGVLLAASFVILGATLAMPSGDERYVRAGLVAACLAVLVFWSWSFPSVPADGGHRSGDVEDAGSAPSSG